MSRKDIWIGDAVQRKDGTGPVMFVYDLQDNYETAYCNWLCGHSMFKDRYRACDLVRLPLPRTGNAATP